MSVRNNPSSELDTWDGKLFGARNQGKKSRARGRGWRAISSIFPNCQFFRARLDAVPKKKGEQFLLQDCRAKAFMKGVSLSQTPASLVPLPTPNLHTKIPRSKIFARGWVAQESIFS